MVTDKITFKAQKNAPSPKEVDYWIDTTSNPNGGEMKYYDGSKWSKVNETDSSESSLEYEFVDLGLPSGLKWATCNLGADESNVHGASYAWGDSVPHEGMNSWENYKFSTDGTGDNLSKYNDTDGKTVLDPEDDAAYQINPSMRIPTNEEWIELKNNTDLEQGTYDGKYGVKLTSKINGNYIILYQTDYWTSTLSQNKANAFCRVFDPFYPLSTSSRDRYRACSIRPVQDAPSSFYPSKYYTKAEIDAKLDAILEQINSAE